MSDPIRSQAELLNAIRRRRDELNISHETIDNIAGFQAGYASKLLCDPPMRNPGPMSLGALLGALGMALVAVPDPEAIAAVENRWQPRKRPQKLPLEASAISIENEVPAVLQITSQVESELRRRKMQELGRIGGLKAAGKGGKARARKMKKRARQAAASHAARMRWAKRAASAPAA